MKFRNNGLTLIEIMVGILIASIAIIVGFQALTVIMFGKVKLIESTNIEKESFSFSQKFFEEVKAGGTIDYEEYFNRKVVNMGTGSNYLSGHFAKNTGFGNSGTVSDGFYYCRSGNTASGGEDMGNGGCLSGSLNDIGVDQFGEKQRYGQYTFHFIDYNSNFDDDGGDEDGDLKIVGDDDDEFLGEGPEVFESGTGVTELYLISADKTRKTLFRWDVKEDPDKPSGTNCDFSNPKSPSGSGCLGTIQFLKLEGKDWGFDHNDSTLDNGQNDGIIDTWLIDNDFTLGIDTVAGNGNIDDYWLPIFPNSVSVKSFDIRVYTNKDRELAWKEEGLDVSPYIRLNMTLTPSWKVKKKIKGEIPEFNISTTINLTDIFTR